MMGITPAYAGNTTLLIPPADRKWDHPRIRGKHINNGRVMLADRGSPPHTRETPAKVDSLIMRTRITPAYAGNTTCKLNHSLHEQDHPRIRGKHTPSSNVKVPVIGSPPHTRETPGIA